MSRHGPSRVVRTEGRCRNWKAMTWAAGSARAPETRAWAQAMDLGGSTVERNPPPFGPALDDQESNKPVASRRDQSDSRTWSTAAGA